MEASYIRALLERSIASAACLPMIIVDTIVFVRGGCGMTDASATRTFDSPMTLRSLSTTLPRPQLPTG
jgi:hypothetical protein